MSYLPPITDAPPIAPNSSLDRNEIHLHHLDLDVSFPDDVLSENEVQRKRRFTSKLLQDRFASARCQLRFLLSRYLAATPQDIEFQYGPHQKPRAIVRGENTDLKFNLSHSGGSGVVAVSRGCEVGVDIEYLRRIEEQCSIANRFFCPEEAKTIRNLPSPEDTFAFYACWTRKEAYLKAIGIGLHASLSSFSVSVRPDESARIVHINGSRSLASAWNLYHIRLSSSLIGALAYMGATKTVRWIPPQF